MRFVHSFEAVPTFSTRFFNSLNRIEDLIALGTHRKRVTRIPVPIDPRIVWIREISNRHMRNFIVTKGAFEFWTAKMAMPKATKNINQ
jgi:hypothetical protein